MRKKHYFLLGLLAVSALASCGSNEKKNDEESSSIVQNVEESSSIVQNETSTEKEFITLNFSKDEFVFDYGVTADQIKNEIRNNITTDATSFEIYNVFTTPGSYSAKIIATKEGKTITKFIKVTIGPKPEESSSDVITISLSKTYFTFDYGVTEIQIENTIKNCVTSNASSIVIANISTDVGTYNAKVIGYKGGSSETRFVTVKINGIPAESSSEIQQSSASSLEQITLSLTKNTFSFDYGVTEEQIKDEIAKYVVTNADYIDIDDVSTSVGSYNATVYAFKNGNYSTKIVTVEIKVNNTQDLYLNITKDSFEFEYEATASEIKTEIEKYVSTNGTLSYSYFETGKAGEQTVVVYSTKGSKSSFKTVTINIKEEVIINLNVSKTYFEFVYGTTASEIQNKIKEFVTTDGTLTFRNISANPGYYTVSVDAIKGSKMVSKTVEVIVREQGEVALDVYKDSFEFKYGDEYETMLEEISKYVSTNGTLSLGTYGTDCGTYQVDLISTLNGKQRTKQITITIVPNDNKIRFQSFNSHDVTSSKFVAHITLQNNTGKEISSFTIRFVLNDGTYVRGIGDFSLTVPSTSSFKNGESLSVNLTFPYNSGFTAFPLSSLGEVETVPGYDYNYYKSTSNASAKIFILEVVYK